jgi:hypothetical protein
MRKVRIKKKGLPNKAHGGPTGGAADGLRRFMEGNKNYDRGMNQFAAPEFDVNKSISAVDISEANVEAEGGEYAVVPGMAGIPESYKINGPRHANGGVPLNLAEDSFIFSDFRDMKIKDKDVLSEFGFSMPKKGRGKGRTPAEIAKKYDLNKYKKVLLDPNSDMLERETAETMIKNFNMKLGKLALIQESKKGFPQGVPAIAMPYLQTIGQDPEQFVEQPEQEQPMMAAYGAGVTGDPSQYSYKVGGENRRMAKRFPGLDIKQIGGEFTGAFWDSILQEGGSFKPHMMYDSNTGEGFRANTLEDHLDMKGRGFTHNPKAQKGIATPKDLMLDYMQTHGFAGDTITVGDKEIFLKEKKYKPYHYTGDLRGKKLDRPFIEGKSIPLDSVATVPGIDPEIMQVHWSKSGKPTPVGPMAKEFIQEYGNYYSKGKANPEVFPSFKRPEDTMTETPFPYQRDGGALHKFIPGYAQEGQEIISEDDYQTAEDARRSNMRFVTPDEWNAEFGNRRQRRRARFNMQTDPQIDESTYTTNPPSVMTYGEWVMKHGTQEEKAAYLEQVESDALVLGKDPAEYVAEELSGTEMTPEELDYFAEDIKGLRPGINFRSLKKELAKEEARANRNSHPMILVDPNTGKIVNFNDKYEKGKQKVGDYIRHPDGRLQRITSVSKKYEASLSGPEHYKPAYGKTIEEDVAKAKEILERNTSNGAFTYVPKDYKGSDPLKKKNKGKWITNKKAKDVLTIAEKDLLTQVARYRGKKDDLGALDLHFGTQRSLRSDGTRDKHFYGFVDPELIEYKYWQANNPGGTADQYQQLSDEDKIANRKDFLNVVGYGDQLEQLEADGRLNSAADLYTDEFMGNDKTPGFKKKFEEGFTSKDGTLRTLGDDGMIGMDHVDNFTLNIDEKYADVDKKEVKDPSKVEKADDPYYARTSTDAPWWAQDVGNMLMTVGERASIKKYLPHSFPVDLAKPDVVYYDPSRALAANAEQANIAAQTLGAFANSQQAAAQMTGIQGQGFAQAANTLADYENKNVAIANQYLNNVQRTINEETLANSERMQRLYDQTTVANQQYDNAKRAANRNVFEAWRQGLTNATKTQTMNMLYPQFNVDPRSGGITRFIEGRPQTIDPTSSSGYAKGYKQFIKDTGLPNDARSYDQYRKQQGLTPTRRRSQRPQGDQFFADYSGMDFYNPYQE